MPLLIQYYCLSSPVGQLHFPKMATVIFSVPHTLEPSHSVVAGPSPGDHRPVEEGDHLSAFSLAGRAEASGNSGSLVPPEGHWTPFPVILESSVLSEARTSEVCEGVCPHTDYSLRV